MTAEKTIFLHVGLPKCGSTLIQETMRKNAGVLESRGFNAFTVREKEQCELFSLTSAVRAGRLTANDCDLSHLRQQISSFSGNIFISHEDFVFVPNNLFRNGDIFFRSEEVIALLARIRVELGIRIKASLVLRPETDWLTSYYIQTVQKGKSWGLDEFSKRSNLQSVSWRRLVNMIEAVGIECDQFSFQNIAKGQDIFVMSFLQDLLEVDEPFDIEIPDKIFNPSLSEAAVKIARAGNKALDSVEDRDALRRFLQAEFSSRSHTKLKPDWAKFGFSSTEVS
tara:strand:- start:288 stop:1130 length:843 start_codon:yes stop_codon:yes gene_type:complete